MKLSGSPGYLAIRIWGAPATIALYAITGWLIAMERTRDVLILQLVQNGLNVVLDIAFVLGLGWGVSGIAAATLIAEMSGLTLGRWFCRCALREAMGQAGMFARHRLARLMRVNGDIMIRSRCCRRPRPTHLPVGGTGRCGSRQAVAAAIPSDHRLCARQFAFAAESLVEQAVGARRRTSCARRHG